MVPHTYCGEGFLTTCLGWSNIIFQYTHISRLNTLQIWISMWHRQNKKILSVHAYTWTRISRMNDRHISQLWHTALVKIVPCKELFLCYINFILVQKPFSLFERSFKPYFGPEVLSRLKQLTLISDREILTILLNKAPTFLNIFTKDRSCKQFFSLSILQFVLLIVS
jgi:hypothetical protein